MELEGLDGQIAGGGTGSGKKNGDVFSHLFLAGSQVCPVLRALWLEGQERIHFSSFRPIPRTANTPYYSLTVRTCCEALYSSILLIC